jgi:hypothetical protein
MKKFLFPLATMLCQGCLGTAVLFEDDDQPLGEFGTLHSVPDRPAFPDMQTFDKARKELEGENKESSQI